MHTLQFDSLLYNKDKLDRPVSWADYWQPREALRREDQGPRHQLQPGEPAVGVRADPCGRARRRRRVEHGARVGDPEGAEALRRRRRHDVGRSGAAFRKRRGLDLAVLERARGLLHQPRHSVRDGRAEGRRDRQHRLGRVPVGAKNKKLAYEFINFMLDPAIQRAWCLAYFCSPGRGDLTDWPKAFADSQIVTAKQFDSVKLPGPRGDRQQPQGLDAASWQEIMALSPRRKRRVRARLRASAPGALAADRRAGGGAARLLRPAQRAAALGELPQVGGAAAHRRADARQLRLPVHAPALPRGLPAHVRRRRRRRRARRRCSAFRSPTSWCAPAAAGRAC